MKNIKVLIFDKNKLYKDSISHSLKEEPEIKSVFSISQIEHFSSVFNKFYPDLVLINMLNLDQKELIKIVTNIKRKRNDSLIFLLDNNLINLDNSIIDKIDQIVLVTNGFNNFYKTIKKYLNSDRIDYIAETSRNYKFHNLTNRELDVMELISQGKSNREIANELIISERTVKNHVSNILKKLSVNDRTQALIKCIKKGIVDIE